MKQIITLHGPVAAGKSTLTKILREKLPDYSYVDRPYIKRGLKPAGKEQALKLSKEVSYFLIKKLMKIKQNIIVQEINPSNMKKYLGKEIKANNYKIISFFITCSVETAIKRDRERKAKTLGEKGVRKIHLEYAIPTSDEIIINTENSSINKCISKILKSI